MSAVLLTPPAPSGMPPDSSLAGFEAGGSTSLAALGSLAGLASLAGLGLGLLAAAFFAGGGAGGGAARLRRVGGIVEVETMNW